MLLTTCVLWCSVKGLQRHLNERFTTREKLPRRFDVFSRQSVRVGGRTYVDLFCRKFKLLLTAGLLWITVSTCGNTTRCLVVRRYTQVAAGKRSVMFERSRLQRVKRMFDLKLIASSVSPPYVSKSFVFKPFEQNTRKTMTQDFTWHS